jgi:hypothetical protein
MKARLLLTAITAVSLLGLSSCKKDSPGRHHGGAVASTSTTLNVTVAPGSEYKLNLSTYGNGAASIAKQAGSFDISEISYSSASRAYVYTYSNGGAKTGETILDKVVLKVMNQHEGNGGGCRDGENGSKTSETTVTVNITVK